MSGVDMSESKNDDVRTTGRTAWDFGTEALRMLGKIGPAVIIVGGILVAGFFFYREVTTARSEADKDLQEKLDQAQTQLISTYNNMAKMSEQQINNVQRLLLLNEQIDKDVEASRDRLRAQELETTDRLRLAREAEASALKAADEAHRQINFLTSELESKNKDIQVRLSELGKVRRELDSEKVLLAKLRKEREEVLLDRAQQIVSLQSQVKNLSTKITSPNENLDLATLARNQEQERLQSSRDVLQNYARNYADISQKELNKLVGVVREDVEEIIRDDIGYALWIDWKDGQYLAGYAKNDAIGMGPYILLDFAKGHVVAAKNRIGVYLVSTRDTDNWYRKKLVYLRATNEEISVGFEDDPGLTEWNIFDLQKTIFKHKSAPNLLYGEYRQHNVLNIDSLKNKLPNIYKQWVNYENTYGGPSQVLSMTDRAKDFIPGKLPGIKQIPDTSGLRGDFEILVKAAVNGDLDIIGDRVDAKLSRSIGGPVAATILRDGFRIDKVVDRSFTDRGGKQTGQFNVQMSTEGTTGGARRMSHLTFTKQDDRWLLSNFSDGI